MMCELQGQEHGSTRNQTYLLEFRCGSANADEGLILQVDLTFFKVPHANFPAPVVDPTLDIHVGLTEAAITYPTRKRVSAETYITKFYHKHRRSPPLFQCDKNFYL